MNNKEKLYLSKQAAGGWGQKTLSTIAGAPIRALMAPLAVPITATQRSPESESHISRAVKIVQPKYVIGGSEEDKKRMKDDGYALTRHVVGPRGSWEVMNALNQLRMAGGDDAKLHTDVMDYVKAVKLRDKDSTMRTWGRDASEWLGAGGHVGSAMLAAAGELGTPRNFMKGLGAENPGKKVGFGRRYWSPRQAGAETVGRSFAHNNPELAARILKMFNKKYPGEQ